MFDDSFEKRSISKPVIGAAAVLIIIAAIGGWYYWHGHEQPPPAAAQATPTPPATPENVIAHPVPENSKAPLPGLNDSDGAFGDALSSAVGVPAMHEVVPESLIRHIVVTVDNLPRQKVAVDRRPVTPTDGSFMADGDELHATLDPDNFKRYQPAVKLLEQVDMQRVAAVYLNFYPLFQQAYQDLGYPNGYFNDRLIQVIDLLLATPQVSGSIDLVRPNVMYVFADQSLESRPAGQKLLIRMGTENAAAVKVKLKELRDAITASAPRR